MSHNPERKEKICLNCNAIIYGRYCHVCGQENTEPKETFWHLLTHLIHDITHFDGKFFITLKDLLFKPGFLSKEYMRGRRASYLHPIRMYVFISAVFFLFFFSFQAPDNFIKITDSRPAKQILQQLQSNKSALEESLADKDLPQIAKNEIGDRIKQVNEDITLLEKDSTQKNNLKSANYYFLGAKNYNSIEEYDSIERSKPASDRDSWFAQRLKKKQIEINHKYNNNRTEITNHMMENFFHSFPKLLFISLPLYALILQLLYLRRRKYYYTDHIIFTLHLYCATFIFIFLMIILSKISQIHFFNWVRYLEFIVLLYSIYYSYRTLQNFYQQGIGKTILKYCILNFIALVITILLFIIFLIISEFTL